MLGSKRLTFFPANTADNIVVPNGLLWINHECGISLVAWNGGYNIGFIFRLTCRVFLRLDKFLESF